MQKSGADIGRRRGAIGGVTRLIAGLYENKPASGFQYLAYWGDRLSIVKPAYAQTTGGTGFNALNFLMDTWRSFRNITYFLFVIIFMVMGLAIMFRIKISPQVVVTIQSAIPKLVIALVLVTFSYAIAGLMIDLMYVVIALLPVIIDPGGAWDSLLHIISVAAGHPVPVENLGVIGMFVHILGVGFSAAFAIGRSLVDVPLQTLHGMVTAGGSSVEWDNLSRVLTQVLGFGLGVIITLIFGFIMLFVFFRIFLLLLSSYIGIIFRVIFAPFQLMLTALPGFEGGVGSWLRGLMADLAVFPAVLAMILLSAKLSTLPDTGAWLPPFLRLEVVPSSTAAATTIPASFVGSLIAFGILMMTPKVGEMVKEALKQPPFKYGSAIGEAVGAAGRPFGLTKAYGVGVLTQHVEEARISGKPVPLAKGVLSFLKTAGWAR